MKRVILLLALATSLLSASAMIGGVPELVGALRAPVDSPLPFEISAHVTCVIHHRADLYIIALREGTSHVCVYVYGERITPSGSIRPGTQLRIAGEVRNAHPGRVSYADVTRIDVLGQSDAAPPEDCSLESIQNGLHDWQFVRVRGLVRDVHPSDTTEYFTIVSLAADNETLQVMVPDLQCDAAALKALIGKRIAAEGFPNLNAHSWRSFAGREFHCPGMSALTVLEDAPDDLFRAPPVDSLLSLTAGRIATMGRVSARGRVICSWSGQRSLIKTPRGDFITLVTAGGTPPARGDDIETSGLPNSDFFHLTLTDARWRKTASLRVEESPCREISASQFSTRRIIRADLHGNPVSLAAVVRDLPDASIGKSLLLVSSEDALVSVDVSAVPSAIDRLSPGCHVRLTGIYIMETEYMPPGHTISQFKGFSLVLRDPGDLVVLSQPSWWTPGKLLSVIGAMLVILLASFAWNASLRRVAKRRSDLLYAARIGQVKSKLKIDERTRLSAELHDSVAQNMKGLDFLIDAAVRNASLDREKMMGNLQHAAHLIRSCREDLRNCLWDLRNRALDEPDMAAAVRQTLKPIVDDNAELVLSLDIARSALSDNTAHAILRIVRELVSNAVHHGRADRVEISGSRTDGKLRISVRDNGCGFDPDSAPGPASGHFGLSGIRERLLTLSGTLQITSHPGRGTTCVLTLA